MPKIDFISDEAEAKSKPLNSFSPMKIHLELTEEQARCVEYALYEVKPASYKDLTPNEKKEEAFIRRILEQLAKAKTSTT